MSRTIRGCRQARPILRSWCTCITRSLYNLVPALKPGARVGIVDAYGPTSEHGTPPDLLACELAVVGFHETSIDRLAGSNAYLAIFMPPSIASRTPPQAMAA